MAVLFLIIALHKVMLCNFPCIGSLSDEADLALFHLIHRRYFPWNMILLSIFVSGTPLMRSLGRRDWEENQGDNTVNLGIHTHLLSVTEKLALGPEARLKELSILQRLGSASAPLLTAR